MSEEEKVMSEEEKVMREEKIIDIKGTLKQFVEADEPEMTQEEAITKYEENKDKNKKASSDDEAENTEEQEHLKRVKQELLASLERVKQLEKQLYNQKELETDKVKVKVNNASGGKSIQQSIEERPMEKQEKERE